ncbi:MAG: NUDIX domain-containing protein [Candidatus Woesearchaeota archaeon]
MVEKIIIRAATITISDGKVLLVNSKYSSDEYYLFPGGGVEFGETIEEGAIRETLEETGIKVSIKKLVHVNEYIFKSDWTKRSIAMFFLSEKIGDNFNTLTNDNGKIKSIEWVDIKKLDTIDIHPKILAELLMKNSEELKLEYSVNFKE